MRKIFKEEIKTIGFQLSPLVDLKQRNLNV